MIITDILWYIRVFNLKKPMGWLCWCTFGHKLYQTPTPGTSYCSREESPHSWSSPMACPCLVHVCWALSLGRHFSFIPWPSPWIHTWDHSPHFFLQSFFYPFPFHFLEHLLYHLKIHINVPQFNCWSSWSQEMLFFWSWLQAWQDVFHSFIFTFPSFYYLHASSLEKVCWRIQAQMCIYIYLFWTLILVVYCHVY